MSIDREINSRVDAFGSNPQALQKRYAATKQLVDLLALQRIKSQKDDVARQIQMEMQSNPATIKQQREQELFGRTAQEVAQQVGGAIQNRQRQQKQGMQRMAQRAAPPQGLGALQQPKRMQAGGIVAFQEGKNVVGPLAEFERIDKDSTYTPPDLLGLAEQADIEELIRRGILPENFKGSLSAKRAKEMLARPISQEPKTEDTLPPVESKPPTPDQTGGIAAVAEPEIPSAKNALVLRSQQNVPTGTSVVPSGSGTAPTEPQEFDLQTALKGVDPVEYTPVDRKDADTTGLARLKQFGMDPETMKSPETAGKEAYDTAAQQLGITAEEGALTKDAERRQGLADLAAIDAAQTDPEKLRRERMKAFLLGAAGRGSTALAASGAASANLGRAQERDVRARQIKRNEMVAEIQNANTELIKSAQARGDTATTRQANMINNAMQTLASYETAEIRARSVDATNRMSAQIANYERKISEIEMFAEQAQNKIQARIDRGDTLRDVQNDARDSLEKVSEQFNALQNEAVRSDPAVQLLNRKIADAIEDDDVDEANRLRRQIPKEVARIEEEFIIANSQLYDTFKDLTDTINRLDSQIQSTVMGDSEVSSQQVDDAVQRQLQKGTSEYLQPYNP